LATGNPILSIGPKDGDAATILNENALSITVNKEEIEKMCEFVLHSTSMKPLKSIESIERFSRRNLTKEIVNLLTN
jgi:hypothetical protein